MSFVLQTTLWLLLAFTNLTWATDNNTCPQNWIYIDIHYRPVDARPDTVSYGLFIGAGANSQNQSLWPAITNNETRLEGNDYCGTDSPSNCLDPRFTHGHYGADASASWQQTPNYVTLDRQFPSSDGVNVTYGTDTLNLFTHYMDPSPAVKTTVANHSITILSDYTSDQDVFFNSGSLGLGPSSTLLTDLVESGKIGRKVVGLYLGTAYPRAGGNINGSAVLGGYDAGRLASQAHEYSLVPQTSKNSSPFKVHVKQLSITTRNNDTISLVTDDGFDGHISTSRYSMDLPQIVLSRLSAALGATPTNDIENVLRLNKPFDGNLTITLDDGFEIQYPAEWISNVSGRTPFAASTANTSNALDQPLVLGAAFLHHLYMTIDYDTNKFFLSDAQMDYNYAMPTSLCPGTVPLQVGPSVGNKFLRTGMIGVILGAVIGGLGLFFCGYVFWRKRLQQKAAMQRRASAASMPKKSSLRSRTKQGLVRLARPRRGADIEPGRSKRVCFTDTSSDKGFEVVVTDVGAKNVAGIELKSLNKDNTQRSDSRMSDDDTLNEVPLDDGGRVRQTTFDLPSPDRFTNPYASTPGPQATPAETPRTGNPLLGNHRGFMQYADDDDSDLRPEAANGHRRTPSETRRRTELGLKIDTSVNSRKKVQDITGRRKVNPLPLRVNSPATRPKNEADYVKSNPVLAIFGRGPNARR